MIILGNKGFQTRSDMPNEDWTGEALYVVEDGGVLAKKVHQLYPYYDFVVGEGNTLIDIVAGERPAPPIRPVVEPVIAISNEDIMLALAEQDAQREQDKTENELALVELSKLIGGGV